MLFHFGTVRALIVSFAEAERKVMKTQDQTDHLHLWQSILFTTAEASSLVFTVSTGDRPRVKKDRVTKSITGVPEVELRFLLYIPGHLLQEVLRPRISYTLPAF